VTSFIEYVWKNFWDWLFLFQSLIAGILAIVAALLMIWHYRIERKKEIERKLIASLAGAPRALSDISEYATKCIALLWKYFQADDDARIGVLKNIPEYPQESFDKLQRVIEFANEEDARIIAEFIGLSQVQYARMRGLEGNEADPDHIVTSYNRLSAISNAYDIYMFADRLFPYARLMDTKIEEFCTADEAANSMHVRHGILNDELNRIITTSWPPRLHRN
jgi:hypothetical protein